MPANFIAKQLRILIVLGFLTTAIIIASYYLVSRLTTANWWVDHTLKVEKEAQRALICLMDCETAYRGYLITGAAEFLEPYETCYRHVAGHIYSLKCLTVDNPQQQACVAQLFSLADKKIKFSQEVIAARKNNPSAPAKALVSLEPGKQIMDEFRHVMADVLNEEERLLDIRNHTLHQLERIVYVIISLLAILVVIALAWIGRMSRAFATEQQRAYRLMAKAHNEAIEANKAKSRFVATISHEIRTPMSGVMGLAEIVQQQPELSSETRELSKQLFNSSWQLLSVLNELLDFSKLESGKMTLESVDFPVLRLINEVVSLVKAKADTKGLHISINVAPAVPSIIKGDETRVRQILLNLLNNAVKFTEKGAIEIAVDFLGEKNQVRFVVIDTGIGIDPEVQKQLFTPFVQGDAGTQRKYGGSGLGLSIAKGYVELMSGTINLKSVPGEGTAVWFTIPVDLVVTDGG